MTPAEHDFIGLIIDSLDKNGIVEVGDLYEQPFTSWAPHGPESLFGDDEIEEIADVLRSLKEAAVPTDAKAG